MSPVRWLQWSTYNLEKGMGGVEVHARALHREFLSLGIDSKLSSDPRILQDTLWDVIQTHGSSPLPTSKVSSLRLHTLHGSTLGRMQACREWFWPGGYAAYARECKGILQSNIVLAVHSQIHLLKFAKALGKKTLICHNGWDSASDLLSPALSLELISQLNQLSPFFCFAGRGNDTVKNTSFLEAFLKQMPQIRLAAIPGEGFKKSDQILKTGPLRPEQVLEVLRRSQGLLLASHYEGMPLVVLEALGNGIPVFSTKVGGLKQLSPEIKGLTFLELKISKWLDTFKEAVIQPSILDQSLHANLNQSLLFNWQQVAEIIFKSVSIERSACRRRLNYLF